MSEHRLKTIPPFWCRVARGEKRFELRRHDRDYQVGDTLRLCEWEPEPTGGTFTGAELVTTVLYVLTPEQFSCRHGAGLAPGWCILSVGDPDEYQSTARVTSWGGHDCACMRAPGAAAGRADGSEPR